jgi:hypothetical protein
MNETRSLTMAWDSASLLAAVALMVVGTILCFWAWRRSGYQRSHGWLELLRWSVLGISAFLLLQPEWTQEYRPEQRPTVAILWDHSVSMKTKDVDASGQSSSARTRSEAIAPIVVDQTWEKVKSKLAVAIESFAGEEEGARTDIESPLAETLTRYPNLRGVVLISDGDWNEGRSPVTAASKLRLAGVPVYTISVGSQSRLPDVELLSLDTPTFAIRGKGVRVPFTIESTLPREYVTTVRLMSSRGEELTQEVRIAPNGRTSDAIVYVPKELGDETLTLSIPKQSDEILFDNNTLTTPMAVREEKLRVLVVESVPRWEYRYLRNALSRDPGVSLSCLLFHPGLSKKGGGNKDYIKEFPKGLEQLSEFDVVFLGDVGVEAGQLSEEDCRLLRGLVEHQASGLVFIPGGNGRQNSLAQTELRDLYPVQLDDAQPGGWGSRQACQFELTDLGRRSLLTKLADTPDENASVWESLPGFQWYAPVVKAKPGVEVLCVHREASNEFGRLPLLATRTFGTGKVLFMGTDGAWRWRKGVEDKYHYRFWGQVVRWMAYQRNMAKGETMRLYYTPEQPALRQTMTLRANVMEKNGEPLAKGEVSARITGPTGRSETVRFSSSEDEWGAFSSTYVPKEPGQHTMSLACRETGSTIEATFFVQGSTKEPIGRAARPDVLDEISRMTGGEMIPLNEWGKVRDLVALIPEPPPRVQRIPLWSHPLTAGVLIVLLSAFWVLRKVVGLV